MPQSTHKNDEQPNQHDENMPSSYREVCHTAIETYNDRFAPCEAEIQVPLQINRLTCIKKKLNHEAMHVSKKRGILGDNEWFGQYYSLYHRKEFPWDEMVLEEVRICETRLRSTESGDV